MENDIGVSQLLELVFGKKPTMPEEKVSNSSIPSDVLNEDFMKKFWDTLRMHRIITNDIWKSHFDRKYREILSSHQQYIHHLMFACLHMHRFNRNIFDSFISAFVLVVNMSNEVLTKARTDFCDLNSDIIMIFYRNILKSSFPELGGFYGFVEYVRGHRYFEWKWDEKDLNLPDSETAFDNYRPDLDENIVKECNSYLDFKEPSIGMINEMDKTAMRISKEVLSTTSVELPTLPNDHDLIKRLVEYRKNQLVIINARNRKALTFEASHGDLGANSVSNTNYDAKKQESIAWHENVIEAVLRHNRSNISHHENIKNQKQVEAENTLEHLKTSIESLIEVLDEFSKE